MDRNQDAEVQRYVEQVYDRGWEVISWPRIYRIYDKDRLSKAVWRDLLERWRDLTKNDKAKPKLFAFVESEEALLLVSVDSDKTPEAKREFRHVAGLADDVLAKIGGEDE